MFLPLEQIGMNAMLVYLMVAEGIFFGFTGGWYDDDPHNAFVFVELQELNSYLRYLFELIVARGLSVGFSVSLNRYDLFHGHLILATESGRLGILFHAREYPAYDKYVFPYNMGYCQKGSHGVGAAIGHACLLLSAGSKGNRSMMPHSIAMIQQPRVPSSGLMPASDVLILAKEPEETIRTAMRRPFYMDGTRAKEFGVIDKVQILWRGQESIIADVGAPEEWDKKAGIKSVDGF